LVKGVAAFSRAPSIKARAIALLSRREHSRYELRRKLSAHCEDESELEGLFDELERGGWLSDERFAESVVHRRKSRHGSRRIMQELRQHGLPESTLDRLSNELRASELTRAREVWQKRFGSAPADAREYARQFRYLAARGFSADCLRRILAEQGAEEPDDFPPPDHSDPI